MSLENKNVFISGAISRYVGTNEGKRYIYNKFMGKEFDLLTFYRVNSVFNPIRITDEIGWNAPHEDYMTICLRELPKVDVVYFFSDWIYSEGARQEYDLAVKLNKQIVLELVENSVSA